MPLFVHNNAPGHTIALKIEDGSGISKRVTNREIPSGGTLVVEPVTSVVRFTAKSKGTYGYKPGEFGTSFARSSLDTHWYITDHPKIYGFDVRAGGRTSVGV